MTDYKSTLNLPHTDFPMKANLAEREPLRLSTWEHLYQTMREARKGQPLFVLHDGPPYANGHLHCGHALNKILKDMIIKSKSLGGYDAQFVPGWDCHGLPIELNVEKKIGKVGSKVDAKTFRSHCRTYALSQIDVQREEFKRLGVIADWDHPYTTMQPKYEANIIRALGRMIENGHIQQGFKPVHWCIDCASSLAEAEVDYAVKRSHSIDVAFKVCDPSFFVEHAECAISDKPIWVPIWTTTPWTLPANEAVALHEDIPYVLIETASDYFLVAESLAVSVMERYGHVIKWQSHAMLGRIFEGQRLHHPFYEKTVPMVLSHHVTLEAGTGCVHTAPAHGPEDYSVGLRYDLPLESPVLANGCYGSQVPLFAGLFVRKADEVIIETLKNYDRLCAQTSIEHSYPHCWRHKTPIIFRATPQWFISMTQQNLREGLLQAIQNVEWVPEWGQARMEKMILDRPDWCISRQRHWGTPLPLWVHRETQTLHPKTGLWIEKVAQRIEEEGIDAWFDGLTEEFLGEEASAYEPLSDTLDVWLDSGVSHFCLTQTEALPIQPVHLYLEGSDQYRGWFNSSLTTSVAMGQGAPYRMVLTHGYTVDGEGRKLSKSAGNYVALEALIRQWGADILRLWVASTDYRHEVSISDEILKRIADVYRRIRNTARFLLSNLFDFDPTLHAVSKDAWVGLDAWLIKRAQVLQTEIVEAYDEYQFHRVYQKIHHFCAIDLGSFYLDIIKDRQYTTPVNSVPRRSCQTAMYHVLQALTRWLAPMISFTADEIWEKIPGQTASNLFLETWYNAWPETPEVDLERWARFRVLRDEVNQALESARQSERIRSSLDADVVLWLKDDDFESLSLWQTELKFFFMTASVTLKRDTDQESVELRVEISPTSHEKCERCWHRCEIHVDLDHPGLCARCIGHIADHAEQRRWA